MSLQSGRCVEDTTFIHSDSIHPTDDVYKLVKQLHSFDVFRVHTAEGDENVGCHSRIIPLVSLATKDIAPNDVVNHLLTAQECGRQHLVSNVKQQLTEQSVKFHDAQKKHYSLC